STDSRAGKHVRIAERVRCRSLKSVDIKISTRRIVWFVIPTTYACTDRDSLDPVRPDTATTTDSSGRGVRGCGIGRPSGYCNGGSAEIVMDSNNLPAAYEPSEKWIRVSEKTLPRAER